VIEKELFDFLRDNYYPDLVMAKSKMSKWDCYSPSKYHRIELKCRTVHYDELLIEKKKFDSMTLKCEDNLDVPYYINSTPKGIYRFNLYKVEPVWFIKKIKATTYFKDSRPIDKEIALLDVIDAEVL
tara:strand:+ start:5537 stop:5917 length:381 start_codon:yes stop_codon:yes gene_type:complete